MAIQLPALSVNPPQAPDVLGQFGNALRLKSLLQGQQIAAQQLQGAEQENQLRALQVKDQQGLREAAKGIDWTSRDAFDQFLNTASQSGVSPQTLSAISLQRQQYLKSVADTDKASNELNLQRNNMLLGHIDSLRGIADPSQRAAAAKQQGAQILSGNLISDPQTKSLVEKMASGEYVPSDEELSIFEGGLIDHNTQIADALKRAQTASAEASKEKTVAETEKTQLETKALKDFGAMTPAQRQAKYIFLVGNKKQGVKLTPDQEAFISSYEQEKSIGPRAAASVAVVPVQTVNEKGEPVTKILPRTEAAGEYAAPPTADQRNRARAFDPAFAVLEDIRKYADKINTKEGASARLSGLYRSAKAKAGYDSDVRLLESKVGELSQLIRALGEKGTLAEGDVTRAVALIPQPSDTKTEKDKKLSDLEAILKASAGTVEKTPGSEGVTRPHSDPLGIF